MRHGDRIQSFKFFASKMRLLLYVLKTFLCCFDRYSLSSESAWDVIFRRQKKRGSRKRYAGSTLRTKRFAKQIICELVYDVGYSTIVLWNIHIETRLEQPNLVVWVVWDVKSNLKEWSEAKKSYCGLNEIVLLFILPLLTPWQVPIGTTIARFALIGYRASIIQRANSVHSFTFPSPV